MIDRDALISRLVAIVGGAYVLTDPADVATYRSDGRGEGGSAPMAIVRPGDADAVASVMKLAGVEQLGVVVQGGRTGLTGAGLPNAEDTLVLSLDRLSRHVEVDPVNRTASVDAGVLLSTLNAAAAEHGLFFPVDLGADPSIGGMIGANTGGARLLRYGDVRSNLLAVDLVCSDRAATRVTLGAALHKNNTGLELKHLVVGGSGATGVVVRATLALQPLPSTQICALVALDDPHAALPLLTALEQQLGCWLSAFEGISRAALMAAADAVPSLNIPFVDIPPYSVLIELSAGAGFDEEMIEDRLGIALSPFMEGPNPPVRDVVLDRRKGLWAIRHAVPEGLRRAGTVVACDIALRRGDVMTFRDRVAPILEAEVPGFEPHDFGHIGDGGIHYNLVWPFMLGPPDPEMVGRARSIIFGMAVAEFGGSFSAEHGIGPRNIEQYARFVPEAVQRLAGSVQRAMAPIALGSVDFGFQENLDA